MSAFDRMKKYSPLVLRAGVAIILLWFSFSQFRSPATWVRMVPMYVQSFLPGVTSIYLNATFEFILATLLLLGLFTRVASALAFLHILQISTVILGYGPTGARDFALSVSALAIFLYGPDEFCLDNIIRKKTNR